MLRKDFLQRQFEEFGKVLAEILKLKKKGSWDEFEKEIEEALKKYTELEIVSVEKMSEDSFNSEIAENTSLSYDKKKILANLLFEKMNFYIKKGEDAKLKKAQSLSLALYTKLQTDLTQNEFDLDVHYKIELLKKIS